MTSEPSEQHLVCYLSFFSLPISQIWKKEVNNPETPIGQAKQRKINKTNKSLLYKKDQKREIKQNWKFVDVTTLLQPDTAEKKTLFPPIPDQQWWAGNLYYHNSQVITDTQNPRPGWCQRKQRKDPEVSLANNNIDIQGLVKSQMLVEELRK